MKAYSPGFLLGPELRAQLRPRLNRRRAFRVNVVNRWAIREFYRTLTELFPDAMRDLRILPISSVEWTSELRKLGGTYVVIFDCEQVNAMTFICNREIGLERPVFHYNEYCVRISELLVGLGNSALALRIAQANKSRLEEYARSAGTFPDLARPVAVLAALDLPLISAHVVPSFLLGHEVGHFFLYSQAGPASCFADIAEAWQSASVADTGDQRYHRFIQPPIFEKFGDDGLPRGTAIFGSRTLPLVLQAQARLIVESQADFVGIVAATFAAIRCRIRPLVLFKALNVILEGMERHLILRRLCERLPRDGGRAAIEFESSQLASRLFMLATMIGAVARGKMSVAAEFDEYWRSAPSDWVDRLLSETELGRLAQGAAWAGVLARGALVLGTGVAVPTVPSFADLVARSGPQRGGVQSLLYVPFYAGPLVFYDLPRHSEWSPEDEGAPHPGLIGFAAAVRDLSAAVFRPVEFDEEFGLEYVDRHFHGHEDLLDLVREPRRFVLRRSFDVPPLKRTER